MEGKTERGKASTLVGLAEESGVDLQAAVFPGKYFQGRFALQALGNILKPMANKVFLFGGEKALASCRDRIAASLETSAIDYSFNTGGRCTDEEIITCAEKAAKESAEMVVGIGGGRALDTAKAIANAAQIGVAIIPTIASTDAPTSTISVVYTPDGRFSHYLRFPKNPDLVIVDTDIIARGPSRFLVAGMGGALGVSYEAEAAFQAGARNMAGGLSFIPVITWATMSRTILLDYGVMAKKAADKNLATPALNRVVEANLLLSGIGFESGGLTAAHGVYHGLRGAIAGTNLLHGEMVAFGTLVQLILENRGEDELSALYGFFQQVGLPYTLSHLGISANDKGLLQKTAEAACQAGTTKNMPFSVDPDMMHNALLFAHELGISFEEEINGK